MRAGRRRGIERIAGEAGGKGESTTTRLLGGGFGTHKSSDQEQYMEAAGA